MPGEQPVEFLNADEEQRAPEQGTALCLSGGGYRAMLFHVGALWRLYELGLLKPMKRISSVSGGSITAGVLGLRWSTLSFDPSKVRQDFVSQIVAPIRGLADRTLDATSIIGGIVSPWSTIADKIADAYRKHLYGDATLQDLPDDPPRFVINATNMQSAALWRFMKPSMRDWRVGEVKSPKVPLAVAVAASSAFPPVLSPAILELDPSSFTPNSGSDLQRKPYTSRVVLSDGGVYDNLGLETAWKRYDTILVSDGGGKTEAEEEPKEDWARHSVRVLNVIDDQVRSLRKRQLIASYIDKTRKGTYWGIRTNIADYQLPDPLPCRFERTMELARTATRLKRLGDELQEQLINWGYAVCDAACRKHLGKENAPEASWPYAEQPLG
jgi:NTE family protein